MAQGGARRVSGFGAGLHVAFFLPSLDGGGAERMRLHLAQAMRARGVRVSMILNAATGALCGQVPEGVEVASLGGRRSAACLPALLASIARLRPDVLIASLGHTNIVALAARLLHGPDCRLIICLHNTLSAERALGWRYRVLPALYRLLAWRADGVIAVSQGVADDFAALTGTPAGRIRVIANPVVSEAMLRASLGPPPHPWLEGDDPALVFAGRLVAQKAPCLALQALAQSTAPGRRLIILGEGELAPAMRAQVAQLSLQSRVHFAGFVQNPYPWLSHARALLLTSDHEGFGNVIAEALALGTPVIATDCPHGPAEILQGGRYGALLPCGDAQGLARAIDALPRPSQDGAGRAMRRARGAQYSVARAVERHLDMIRQITTAPPIFGLTLGGQSLACVIARLLQPAPGVALLATPNLDHVRHLRRADFAQACARAAYLLADGIAITLYARLRGRRLKRVTGCALLAGLLADPRLRARRLVLVVETAATLQAAQAWLAARGRQDDTHGLGAGPPPALLLAADGLLQHEAGERRLIAQIAACRPDIVVMTLGAPVSEVFCDRNRAALPPAWYLCLGQALRVQLGLVRRAPRWMQAAGLEWLWRLGQEPRRLLPRYARAAWYFPRAALADWRGMTPGELGRAAPAAPIAGRTSPH